MKNERNGALLLCIIVSLLTVEAIGIWVRETGQIVLPGHQPGVTYACLYAREKGIADMEEAVMNFRQQGNTEIIDEEPVLEEEMENCQEAYVQETKEPQAWEPPAFSTEEIEIQEETQEEISEPEPLDPMTMLSDFEEVDDSYFEDALFIGDSRVVGLETYCEIPGAEYAAQVGLTIYRAMDKQFLPIEGQKTKKSIRELLGEKQYKKIYLMVGVNELGSGNEQLFNEAYREVLDEIVSLQPQAVIFVQSILHVTAGKSKADRNINNENINIRNEGLKQLADQKRIFYLDINSVYDDEEGNLQTKLSGDGVHLKAQYYETWKEYLYAHGIIKSQT
ncbi:MAG: GDSL-type esterase/lipase family protein [Lachnospiraceae bacterium]|nr:GDSL-type esterase/lipase family protein [Lachnospiraceae bacterium]